MITFDNKYGETIIFTDDEYGKQIAKEYIKLDKPYPSVGKVLDSTSDKTSLYAWRERVGAAEADRISKESLDIGKSFDEILFEHYRGTDCHERYADTSGYKLYKQSEKYLKNIVPIAMQLDVYSHKLKMHGYIDCLCYYKGKLTLLDFKNSKNKKHENFLTNYYLQCTYYAMMIYDMFGIQIEQIVLFIGMRNDFYPDIRIEKTKNFVKEAVKRKKIYYKSLDKETT